MPAETPAGMVQISRAASDVLCLGCRQQKAGALGEQGGGVLAGALLVTSGFICSVLTDASPPAPHVARRADD